MLDLAESLQRPAADALRGRVRSAQVWILLLERDQLAQQVVVVGVRDLGVVELVVALVVVLDLAPQALGALGGSGCPASRGHQGELALVPPATGRSACGPAASPSTRADRSQPSSSSMRSTSVSSKCSGVTEIMSASIAAKSVPSSW